MQWCGSHQGGLVPIFLQNWNKSKTGPAGTWLTTTQCDFVGQQVKRNKWFSLAASHTVGKAGCSLMFLLFPLWEKSQTKKSSLVTDLYTGGGGTWVKWKCSFYSLDSSSIGLFCSNSLLELLHWKHRFSQRDSFQK